MNVSLELVCFIVSRMTDTWECEESAMNRDRSLLQTVLDTINIILFPDLRPVDGDVDTSMISTDKEEGAYFPHIINTIGFAMCRPVMGNYLSLNHKKGFDEVGDLKRNNN